MSVSQQHPHARLAEHVRACRVGDQMILLDLRRSKYIGIGGTQLPALSAALLGRSGAEDEGEAASTPALPDEWLCRLHGQRLLSEATVVRPKRERPRPIEPIAALPMPDDDRAVSSEWIHLFRLWRATLVASAWLRGYSLASIADRIATLRTSHSQRSDGLPAEAMHAEAARYMRLRPFALTTHDQCLKDSLTLIHFLATRGLFPRWVIGVRVHPFGAHSWVQSDEIVLNDLPERVRQYQPILIV
jgi:hypothetical protein